MLLQKDGDAFQKVRQCFSKNIVVLFLHFCCNPILLRNYGSKQFGKEKKQGKIGVTTNINDRIKASIQ